MFKDSFLDEGCHKSLDLCNDNGSGEQNRNDYSTNCPYWASLAECSRNPAYMRANCAKICNF